MKSFKRLLRLIGLALFLVLALTGIGIVGRGTHPLKKAGRFYRYRSIDRNG